VVTVTQTGSAESTKTGGLVVVTVTATGSTTDATGGVSEIVAVSLPSPRFQIIAYVFPDHLADERKDHYISSVIDLCARYEHDNSWRRTTTRISGSASRYRPRGDAMESVHGRVVRNGGRFRFDVMVKRTVDDDDG
jgi:hypothetical protein